MNTWFRRVGYAGLVTSALVSCIDQEATTAAVTAAPGEVIARARLGNNTEELAFVDRGRLANHVIAVDGGEVLAIPAFGRRPIKVLFNTADLGLLSPPRGVGFLADERRLVFNDPVQRDRLFITDLDGGDLEVLPIQYPPGSFPGHVEAIEVLPDGTIAMVAWRFSAGLEAWIEIIERDGTVVSEIEIDPSITGGGITALVRTGEGFLVSPVNDQIYAIGLDGSVIGAPVQVAELESIEGIAAVRNGIVAAGYGEGRLIGFDRNLQRRPRLDRDFVIGHGYSRVGLIAWDDDSASFRVGAQIIDPSRIAAVSADLTSLEVLVTLAEPSGGVLGGISTVAGEDRLVAAHAVSPNGILLFDDTGELVEEIDLGPRPPVEVAYIEATGELAVAFFGEPPTLIHFFSRDGIPTRSIDLAGAGIPRVFGLDHDGERLVVGDGSGLVYETDLEGALIETHDYSASLEPRLRFPTGLAVLRTGANPGALAFSSGETNEIVVVARQ